MLCKTHIQNSLKHKIKKCLHHLAPLSFADIKRVLEFVLFTEILGSSLLFSVPISTFYIECIPGVMTFI